MVFVENMVVGENTVFDRLADLFFVIFRHFVVIIPLIREICGSVKMWGPFYNFLGKLEQDY